MTISSASSFRELEGQQILARLYEEPTVAIAVDTETTGLRVADPDSDYCIGVSIAGLFEDGTPFSHYFGVAHETGVNVSRETVDMLYWVLKQPGRVLVLANVQFDILSLETIGIDHLEDQDIFDILTMAFYVNENQPRNKGLDSLAVFYLGEKGKIVDPFVEKEKKSGNRNITPEQMYDYAEMDAVSTWRVWDVLIQHPVWLELPKTIWPNKQELIRVLVEMRRRGVLINQPLARDMVAQGEAEMKRLARELGYPAVPKKPTRMYPNPDPDPLPTLGPIALYEIFIERLGLPPMKPSAKTGKPSFDKEVMEEYDLLLEDDERPEAQLVKEYRGWQKAVSASYRAYLELVGPDGRIRCSYKTHGTVTGRLSCAEPNLQQIPKTSDKLWNGSVKACFVAREGYTLINADYSQLELRLGTAYAGEESLKQVFNEGRDIFTEMSQQLGFSRQQTKTFVYSIQYGAGPPRIMNVFHVTKAQARMMISNYYNTYPAFKMLSNRCTSAAEREGRVKLWSGRYRHFQYRSEAYKAMNSVIQGGAADIVERVMVRCFRELDNPDCRMLLQVHDSITWEVKTELVDEYIPKIQAMMEDVAGAVGHDRFDVHFAVEVGKWVDDA